MVWLLLMGGSVLERRACISGSLIPQEGRETADFSLYSANFGSFAARPETERKPKADVLVPQPRNQNGASPKEKDMKKEFRLLMGAAIAASGLMMAGAASAAPHGVKVGELTCNVASGWGFVFGSSKDLHCTFRQNNRPAERYTGAIS
ncbi:MAG TPA: DUF992 domain-containing protein, partial [Rhizomicrobium sp.]|nr:DUF992 domain-containing protein [Rhizomicrobium sp.]